MENINEFLQHTRHQYDKGIISDNQLLEDPIKQFEMWMKEAITANVAEPNAMVLSSVSDQCPSSRIVLLKGVDESGFTFFTNYESRKGMDMKLNPNVSLNFFWQIQSRQIRIEGKVEKVSSDDSDLYFKSRPRDSQIGAWGSSQSTLIKSRQELDDAITSLNNLYKDREIPRPPQWGGYLIRPNRIEFWQGRPNRLHDRFLYELSNSEWRVFRLAP